MSIESIFCPVCTHEYAAADREPMTLKGCGHSACSACVPKLKGRCIECRSPIGGDNVYVINRLALDAFKLIGALAARALPRMEETAPAGSDGSDQVERLCKLLGLDDRKPAAAAAASRPSRPAELEAIFTDTPLLATLYDLAIGGNRAAFKRLHVLAEGSDIAARLVLKYLPEVDIPMKEIVASMGTTPGAPAAAAAAAEESGEAEEARPAAALRLRQAADAPVRASGRWEVLAGEEEEGDGGSPDEADVGGLAVAEEAKAAAPAAAAKQKRRPGKRGGKKKAEKAAAAAAAALQQSKPVERKSPPNAAGAQAREAEVAQRKAFFDLYEEGLSGIKRGDRILAFKCLTHLFAVKSVPPHLRMQAAMQLARMYEDDAAGKRGIEMAGEFYKWALDIGSQPIDLTTRTGHVDQAGVVYEHRQLQQQQEAFLKRHPELQGAPSEAAAAAGPAEAKSPPDQELANCFRFAQQVGDAPPHIQAGAALAAASIYAERGEMILADLHYRLTIDFAKAVFANHKRPETRDTQATNEAIEYLTRVSNLAPMKLRAEASLELAHFHEWLIPAGRFALETYENGVAYAAEALAQAYKRLTTGPTGKPLPPDDTFLKKAVEERNRFRARYFSARGSAPGVVQPPSPLTEWSHVSALLPEERFALANNLLVGWTESGVTYPPNPQEAYALFRWIAIQEDAPLRLQGAAYLALAKDSAQDEAAVELGLTATYYRQAAQKASALKEEEWKISSRSGGAERGSLQAGPSPKPPSPPAAAAGAAQESRAAAAGPSQEQDPMRLLRIGMAYKTGREEGDYKYPQDHKRAILYLQQAIECETATPGIKSMGHYELAEIFRDGKGVEANRETAKLHYLQAQFFALELKREAEALPDGEAVKEKELFRAQLMLDQLQAYKDCYGESFQPAPNGSSAAGPAGGSPRAPQDAEQLFKQGEAFLYGSISEENVRFRCHTTALTYFSYLDQEHPDATDAQRAYSCLYLGRIYEANQGVIPDAKLADSYYERARTLALKAMQEMKGSEDEQLKALIGEVEARSKRRSQPTPPPAEARAAAGPSEPRALLTAQQAQQLFQLGVVCLSGGKVPGSKGKEEPPSPEKAARLFEKVFKAELAPFKLRGAAALQLARAYVKGEGVEQSVETAKSMYQAAFEFADAWYRATDKVAPLSEQEDEEGEEAATFHQAVVGERAAFLHRHGKK